MFRSLLFIPGNNPSMIQNADVYNSDGIIFDLEDSVNVNEKNNARNLVKNYLNDSKTLPFLSMLRINSVDSIFFKEDLELIKINKIDYIILPKSNIESLKILEENINKIDNESPIKVIALIESAKSVIEAFEIGKLKRVKGLLLGAEDLCKDLEIERTNQGNEILYARSRLIYACASNEIISIDTPNTNVDNENELEFDCLNAKKLGMKAKTAIHPSQLEIINEIFSPSKKEIEWAKKVINLVGVNQNKGAFNLNGKMIDKPLIEKANKILIKAKRYKLV